MEVDESFLVQFIFNSLASVYGPFQINYNTMKNKWSVDELHSILVQEETKLKNHGNHSIHCVNHQSVGKKVDKKIWNGQKTIKDWRVLCQYSEERIKLLFRRKNQIANLWFTNLWFFLMNVDNALTIFNGHLTFLCFLLDFFLSPWWFT